MLLQTHSCYIYIYILAPFIRALLFCVFVFNEFSILLNLNCPFIHFSIKNDEYEATGTEINFDICHNYLKVGGCLNYDSFVINVYVIIR